MLHVLVELLKDKSHASVVRGRSRSILRLLSLSVVFCAVGQAYAAPELDGASSLLPLETGTLSNHQFTADLSIAADSINAAFAKSQNPEPKTDELDIIGMPIVRELLDENGKFNGGMDIPITFDFGDLVGNPVLIVGTDFTTD